MQLYTLASDKTLNQELTIISFKAVASFQRLADWTPPVEHSIRDITHRNTILKNKRKGGIGVFSNT